MSLRVPDERKEIRAEIEVFDVGDTQVAMISDPDNKRQWIQSDVTQHVEQ